MRAEEVREYLRSQPFSPFRVWLSDGSFHDVRHPEMGAMGARSLFIVRNDEDGVERAARCDLAHITRIEHLPGDGIAWTGDA